MDGLLVGRDAECAALRGRLAVPRAGPLPVVLVAGEAGAGKTTLVEHVLATASTPVLRGRAAAWACPAYEVVASALRPAVRHAAEPLPAVLAQILPELGAPPSRARRLAAPWPRPCARSLGRPRRRRPPRRDASVPRRPAVGG